MSSWVTRPDRDRTEVIEEDERSDRGDDRNSAVPPDPEAAAQILLAGQKYLLDAQGLGSSGTQLASCRGQGTGDALEHGLLARSIERRSSPIAVFARPTPSCCGITYMPR